MPSDDAQEATLTWAVPSHLPDGDLDMPEVPQTPAGLRYIDLGPIARGGMGEVRRVRDRRLDCLVAMKVLGADLVDHKPARARFINEGTITAQLRHPGIVAVHDRGERDDRRLWYTMTEVHGRTLAQLIREEATEHGLILLRRRVAILQRVCDAITYAHEQGVTHRDLKPDNLMVGDFGEVMVMDWGIAVRSGGAVESPGTVIGTPMYMAPEQARGETGLLGPWSDVYALGAILHELLTGTPPMMARGDLIIELHRSHELTPFREGVPPQAPPELVELCLAALTDDPHKRTPHARVLNAGLQAWLDGAEQRARAEATFAGAMERFPEIAALRQLASSHRAAAQGMLAELSTFAPPQAKEDAWAEEDRAAALEREAVVLEANWLQQVGAALEQASDLRSAHEALADYYAARLMEAEARRQPEEVARYEVHLAEHDRGRHRSLLDGAGAITLVTDPPGALVRASRYLERKRRLVPVFERELGRTPLIDAPLERGSWLLELIHPDRPPVVYPVCLGRGESWSGARPGESEPFPIGLLPAGDLGEGDLHVPAGFSWTGGDPEAVEPLPRRRLWIGGMVVRRDLVTCGEFLELRDRHPALEAARPVGPHWDPADGSWQGEPAQLDLPVVGLNLEQSTAVALCEAKRTGWPWRLPNELEFERYARGADGRHFAFGDQLEPTWANVLGSDPKLAELRAASDYPLDISPFGVRETAGNARERCANAWEADGPVLIDGRLAPRQPAPFAEQFGAVRGGSYNSSDFLCRAASRFTARPAQVWDVVGLRLVRDA